MCLFELQSSQGVGPVVGYTGQFHSHFFLKGSSVLFSQVAISIYIPINTGGGFSFLHIFFSIIVCRFFWWWWFWPVWGNTSRFILNIAYSMGSYTYIMVYSQCYIIIQRILFTLNPSVLHLFILPLISSMGQTLIFLMSPWFTRSRISYGWNHVIWWLLVRLASFTWEYELNFFHIFSWLDSSFLFSSE